MKLFSTALVLMSLVIGISADARPGDQPNRPHRPGGGWHGDNSNAIKNGRKVKLGTIKLGKFDGQWDGDVIDLRKNSDVKCDLTHIQMTAERDSVLITRVVVDYRWGKSDTIDLDDRDDNRPRPPGRRGIHLRAGESSKWLDIDDVVDGRPDGRCVERIRIYGADTPDKNNPWNPGNWRPDRPAKVKVTGLLKRRGHHGGRP